jgi:hypothetical protein
MKIYLALLCTSLMSCAVSAHAGEAYYYGDGRQAFVLEAPTALSAAIDKSSGLVLHAGELQIPLTESLGRGGDVVYLDSAGDVVLRKPLEHSAIFYQNAKDKGQPVLRGQDAELNFRSSFANDAAPALPVTLDEWSKAYAYKGKVKTANTAPALKTAKAGLANP